MRPQACRLNGRILSSSCPASAAGQPRPTRLPSSGRPIAARSATVIANALVAPPQLPQCSADTIMAYAPQLLMLPLQQVPTKRQCTSLAFAGRDYHKPGCRQEETIRGSHFSQCCAVARAQSAQPSSAAVNCGLTHHGKVPRGSMSAPEGAQTKCWRVSAQPAQRHTHVAPVSNKTRVKAMLNGTWQLCTSWLATHGAVSSCAPRCSQCCAVVSGCAILIRHTIERHVFAPQVLSER